MGQQRSQSTDVADNEFLPAWVRFTSGGFAASALPVCPKWQDLVFHSATAAGLAWAWAVYSADPLAFDAFGRFALFFFSVAWVVTCSADYIQHGRSIASQLRRASTAVFTERD